MHIRFANLGGVIQQSNLIAKQAFSQKLSYVYGQLKNKSKLPAKLQNMAALWEQKCSDHICKKK